MLKPQFLAMAEEHVKNVNLSRIILIENLQQIIESENPSPSEILQLQNRKGEFETPSFTRNLNKVILRLVELLARCLEVFKLK